MKRKNVGLTTCFIDNYGACLQAYALQTKIEETGAECKIIKYTEPDGYKRKHNMRDALKGNRLFLFFVYLFGYKPFFKYLNKPKFQKFRNKYLKFTTDFDSAEDVYKANLDFDVYVCGSDQIWNPLLFNGNNAIYTLDFVPDGRRRIAYAPSIGISEFPEEYREDFKNKLERFDLISVRESTGQAIAQSLTDKEVKVVLDPTLLLDGSDWNKIAIPAQIQHPYIFCYLFGTRKYIGEFVEYVHRKTRLNVVCIPLTEREEKADHIKIYNAGPCEFLGLIRDAALVITDSFHATAFSINFNTPFYSLLRNKSTDQNNMNSRIENLLSMLNLENRLITDRTRVTDITTSEMDFSTSNEMLSRRREKDFGFLKKALDLE